MINAVPKFVAAAGLAIGLVLLGGHIGANAAEARPVVELSSQALADHGLGVVADETNWPGRINSMEAV